MPRQRIEAIGSIGLNTDVPPTLLPPQAVTTLRNVVTSDGALRSGSAFKKLFNVLVEPRYTFQYKGANIDQYLIVSDGIAVYAYSMQGVGEEITPTEGGWNGGRVTFCNHNTVLVVNSASDGAFYWPGPSSPLLPLPGWDTSWQCVEMASYKYFLVALGMTEGGTEYLQKLRWSNSAAEGELPTAWTPTIFNDAGDDLVGETAGAIVTSALVRDQLAIVKTDALYSMNWIGGNNVMQVTRVAGGIGSRIPDGVAEWRGNLLIFSTDDLLLWDGQGVKSIVDRRVRNGIFDEVDPQYWDLSKLYVHYPSNRVLIGVVPAGQNRITAALIWDWEEDTWTVRDGISHGYGFTEAVVNVTYDTLTWDGLETTPVPWGQSPAGTVPFWEVDKDWDSQDGSWNKNTYSPILPDLLVFESNEANTEWWVSLTNVNSHDMSVSPISTQVERVGLPIEGVDGFAQINAAWIEASGDQPFLFYVGAHDYPDEAPRWEPPWTIVPGRPTQVTPRCTGRFIAWRIESNDRGVWEVSGITFDWQRAGER
jgi:hypothetical protein